MERRWAAQIGRQYNDPKEEEKAAEKSERATIAGRRDIWLEVVKANAK